MVFSTTTMASSTTMPMASTNPNRVRLLIDWPVTSITAKVPIRETGNRDRGYQRRAEVLQKDIDRQNDQQDGLQQEVMTLWIEA